LEEYTNNVDDFLICMSTILKKRRGSVKLVYLGKTKEHEKVNVNKKRRGEHMRSREEITIMTLDEKMGVIRKCETAFVVDAMNLMGLTHWWVDDVAPLKEGSMMVGQAFTARLTRLRKNEPAINAYQLVDQCPEGKVLIIANIKETFLIGGNVVTSASNKGIAGMVIEAKNRDIADIRPLPMPVFSHGVGVKVLPSPIKVSFEYGMPIEMGGGKIYPDDIIMGDDNGVIVIPSEHLDEILYQLEMIVEVEKEAAAALKENKMDMDEFAKIIAKKKNLRK